MTDELRPGEVPGHARVTSPPGCTLPDLSICDREPITRLERIQSFGFLLAMRRDWAITRASANLDSMLGIEPRYALGLTLDTVVDHALRIRIRVWRPKHSGQGADIGAHRVQALRSGVMSAAIAQTLADTGESAGDS
jgi:light-regulated signal transduction histidine kinase (bacteriophytochrome)